MNKCVPAVMRMENNVPHFEDIVPCAKKSAKVQNRPQTFSNGPENTLSLPDTAKNVGYDFRMSFRLKNTRKGKHKWSNSLIGTF